MLYLSLSCLNFFNIVSESTYKMKAGAHTTCIFHSPIPSPDKGPSLSPELGQIVPLLPLSLIDVALISRR